MLDQLTALAATTLAAEGPAGGAETAQVVIATAGAMIATTVLLALALGHRSGRLPILGRWAGFSERVSGLPGWAALPSGVSAVSLIIALLGMYWDISLHIDNGRDAGPLANPSHYLILVGLFGVFAAGVLAMALPVGERPGRAAIRIHDGWYAPVGGVLIAACGAFALIGFPLDDVWHRLFGQDVTLWGPTHLMLIGGAGMTLVGQAVLLAEGMRSRREAGDDPAGPAPSIGRLRIRPEAITAARRVGIVGGFLIGLSTFQGEFDFGVPQFRFVFHPFLIALAAGVALVAARLWIGRGGALLAAGFFLVVRGIISLIVGPILGETTPSLPLYLGEALCVEVAALFLIRRPLAFGAVSGLLIGTVGFASEWAWTQLAFRLPWNSDLLPEGLIFAVLAGVAGGLVGALLSLGLRARLPRPTVARATAIAALLAVAACVAAGLSTTEPRDARASVTLQEAPSANGREANATVRIDPPELADGAGWVTVTAWQGNGLHVDRLKKVADGVYRTNEPIPLHGNWKSLVRVQAGRSVIGIPVYMRADPAIPVGEVPAPQTFTRSFQADHLILQRERKQDSPGWLWTVAGAAVLALYAAFLIALAWGVGRFSRRQDRPADPGAPPAERAEPRPVPRPRPAGA